MLYPRFSSYWYSKNQSKVVTSYNEALNEIPQENYEKEFEAAEIYNESLGEIDFPFRNFDLIEGYEEILDVSGTGIMGYLSIEKIDVELPIYHGTSEGVLQIGVGHMQGSSLPTGGIGNHIVLSAHNGLTDAELFTNLNQMQEGDIFTITVLDRELTYQVDQIVVVEPQDFSELYTDKEKDYCTLLTCTPLGVNSHRLLVRGVRIDEEEGKIDLFADATLVAADLVTVIIFSGICVVLLLIWIVWYYFRRKKKIRWMQAMAEIGKKKE